MSVEKRVRRPVDLTKARRAKIQRQLSSIDERLRFRPNSIKAVELTLISSLPHGSTNTTPVDKTVKLMNSKYSWIFAAALTVALCGCASPQRNAAESGETKVSLAQTPTAVRQVIERELVGAQLEDIARKERAGRTVYETDLIRDGHKWEVVVAEDGQIISKLREGSAEERKADRREEATTAGWRETFNVSKADLAPTGSNAYLAIQPGRVLRLAHGTDRLTVSILSETSTVDGITTGVLEEREEKDGQLIEVSRNFFATDQKTGDVYYFGEDVDNYKDGKIINHDSAWLSGRNGARFGLMIPGKPKVGDKFYQEIAPSVALDRVEVVSVDATVKTPAGTFRHCVHLRETTPLDPDVSHKYYAPGIGMIKDDEFELVENP